MGSSKQSQNGGFGSDKMDLMISKVMDGLPDVSLAVLVPFSLAFIITCYLLFQRPKQRCPKHKLVVEAIHNADKRLSMAAVDMARALRNRDFTSEEITRLYIKQIKRVNPHLNAVVAHRFDDALKEARNADRLLDEAYGNPVLHAQLPPFLGVPCIIKEVFEFPGFPFTGGVLGRKEMIGKRRSPPIQRLQNAGAIILGCGNTSEGCMWSESSNLVHGCSNNPYDLSRTPGGSSGGNASIVSALGGAFAITSDVGGSTRIPALYNGLFGHKPSGGAIPNCRTYPPVHGLVERYCQLGPCVRHAKDIYPLLKILAGPTEVHELEEDATPEEMHQHAQQKEFMRHFDWVDPHMVKVNKLKYYVVWDQPGVALGLTSKRHDDMIAAQKRVVETLERELGVEVKSVQFPALKKCFDIWAAMLQQANGENLFVHVISEGKGGTISPLWEILKWLVTFGHGSDHTLPALGLALAEKLKDLTPKKNADLIRLGHELRDEINELLGDDGVIIFPGLPNPAPTHGPFPNLLYFADFAACGIFNTLELPATAVPLGLTSTKDYGIPVGIQLIAGNGHDHLSIAVAMALEDAKVAGWVPPLKD